MDLTVPGGMGGREALEEIRRHDPAIRAIVSSGYASDPIMANFRQHGFQGVVAKPYRIEDFIRVVHEVLEAGPST
jgi:CheY-like chemotaxis protein